MTEQVKVFAINHKICDVLNWTWHGTDDFLGSDGLDQGLYLKIDLGIKKALIPMGDWCGSE